MIPIKIPCPKDLEYLSFQEDAVQFMYDKSSILLCDEMGLGKTVEAIGYINAHLAIQSILVVCPSTLKINWAREMEKWIVEPRRYVKITNYDQLAKLKWDATYDLCILDEGTYIKNRKALRSRLCRRIRAKRKMILTGTPLMNRPVELWHLLHWLIPGIWPMTSYRKYTLRYCGAYLGKWGWVDDGATHLDELRELLKGVMIRRSKAEVLPALPPKRWQLIELPLDGVDGWMKRDLAEVNRKVDFLEDEYAEDIGKLNSRLKVVWDEMSALRHKVGLSKVPMAVDLIKDALENEAKIVVFAHHRDVIEGLMSKLTEFDPVVIHGGVTQVWRQSAVDKFQGDPSCRVFIGQIQAAGMGITLTAASHVVFVESDWTPGMMDEAADRCHRIGQKESVLIQHLVLEKSLDVRMAKALLYKQRVINQVLSSTPTERKGEKIMLEEVLVRIAVALEKLAGCCSKDTAWVAPPSKGTAGVRSAPEEIATAAVETTVEPASLGKVHDSLVSLTTGDPETQSGSAVDPSKMMDREVIKSALRNLKIKFKDSARTETLQRLLNEAGSNTGSAPPEVVQPPITKEKVRDSLIALASLKGKDEALKVLKAIGKAETVSNVDPIYYMAIVDACKVRGVV